MNVITATWPGRDVVRSVVERPTAMRLAEYQRVVDAVRALWPGDWSRPTDCPPWDVRQLVAHLTGMAKFISTPLEMARQLGAAMARRQVGRALVNAQTGLPVDVRRHLGPDELRAELCEVAPRWARARRHNPGVVRRLPEPRVFNGVPTTWSIGYLTDVILTRDPWMHGLDLARATGQTPVLTADHDGVIAADVVAEWRAGPADRTGWTSPALPAAAVPAAPTASRSSWTPPISAGSSPAAQVPTPHRRRDCSRPKCPADEKE